ncbi:MAG: DUF305 domain-containing protein [Alphaproteobacteria bacterium]|nr:DUF305 domain-containing protein [Alphaproteobacteria bacterium]
MERSAGSVPVYGAKKPCCGGDGRKCPMKGAKKEAYSPSAYDGVMAKMHHGMAVPATGDADADFVRGMIPHHQGAIDMAQVVLKQGDDAQVRALARNIIRAQKGEIAWMKRWLELRQIPETGEYRMNP